MITLRERAYGVCPAGPRIRSLTYGVCRGESISVDGESGVAEIWRGSGVNWSVVDKFDVGEKLKLSGDRLILPDDVRTRVAIGIRDLYFAKVSVRTDR
jgi:hypothetical protein